MASYFLEESRVLLLNEIAFNWLDAISRLVWQYVYVPSYAVRLLSDDPETDEKTGNSDRKVQYRFVDLLELASGNFAPQTIKNVPMVLHYDKSSFHHNIHMASMYLPCDIAALTDSGWCHWMLNQSRLWGWTDGKSDINPLTSCEKKSVPHWCDNCPGQIAEWNRLMLAAFRDNEEVCFSLSPSSPWLLYSYGAGESFADPDFGLLHMPSNTYVNLGDLPQTAPTGNIMLEEAGSSDLLWATTSTSVASYIWYGIRYLSSMNKDMMICRHNIRNHADRTYFSLKDTMAKDGYEACHIYSNQTHVYCVVYNSNTWASHHKTSLKPKVFCFDSEKDQMVEIGMPEQEPITLKCLRGKLTQESLDAHNDFRLEQHHVSALDMSQYEDLVYWMWRSEQDTSWKWQLKEVMVAPETGDLLLVRTQYQLYAQLQCMLPRSLVPETWYYSLSKKSWSCFQPWDSTSGGSVFGPIQTTANMYRLIQDRPHKVDYKVDHKAR